MFVHSEAVLTRFWSILGTMTILLCTSKTSPTGLLFVWDPVISILKYKVFCTNIKYNPFISLFPSQNLRLQKFVVRFHFSFFLLSWQVLFLLFLVVASFLVLVFLLPPLLHLARHPPRLQPFRNYPKGPRSLLVLLNRLLCRPFLIHPTFLKRESKYEEGKKPRKNFCTIFFWVSRWKLNNWPFFKKCTAVQSLL